MRNHAILIRLANGNNALFIIEGFKSKDVTLEQIKDKITLHYERLYENVKVTNIPLNKRETFVDFELTFTEKGYDAIWTRRLTWTWLPSHQI